MKKNGLLLLLIFAALTVLLPIGVFARGQASKGSSGAAPVVQEEYDGYVVKIARSVTNGLCSAPFFIAEINHLYEEEGLKWEAVFQSSGEGQMNITTGKTDATTGLIPTLINPVVNGYEIYIPLAIHTGCSVILAKKSSGIKDPLDLVGKRVGVGSLNGSAVVLLQRILGMAGYKVVPPFADVEFVVFPSADLPLALSSGSVDAIALGEPTATIAQEDQGDLMVVFDSAISESFRDEFCCTVTLRTGFVEEHPVAAAKFVRAIQRASAFVQENPLKTAELMAEHKYVAGDPVRNGKILATYNYKATVSGARDAIARNLEEMVKIGVVTEKIDPVELTNRLFVQLPNVPDSLYEWVGK